MLVDKLSVRFNILRLSLSSLKREVFFSVPSMLSVADQEPVSHYGAGEKILPFTLHPDTCWLNLVKNWSAIFLATPSISRAPTCAILPPTLALAA